MKLLFFGDVVGKPGRTLLIERLPKLRERFGADAVVVNGENATDGKGIKASHAEMLFGAGADVITTGNHVWRQRDIYRYLGEQPRLIRPYNFLRSNPGNGVVAVDTPGGRLGVVAMGQGSPPGMAERIYEWFHRRMPVLVDCRPIDARAMVEAAGFIVQSERRESMWGLPVVVLGLSIGDF